MGRQSAQNYVGKFDKLKISYDRRTKNFDKRKDGIKSVLSKWTTLGNFY